MLNKNDVIEISIDGIGYGGEGVAHLGGYTVFIKNALPQERVRALVILAKPTFAVAKLTEVITASQHRGKPFCPVFGKCGGCSLQHLNYAEQLTVKTEAVADAFYKIARQKITPQPTVASPQTAAYRNKMSIPVRGDKMGFFAENSHRVVEIDSCPIQFDGNGELITAFKEFFYGSKLIGYDENDGSGAVRAFTARRLGGVTTVTVTVNGERYVSRLKPFELSLKKLYGSKYAYYININTARNNVILGSESVFVGGSRASVDVDGLLCAVHPQSFFQVNDGVRKLLYDAAAAEADGDTVFDCYSGSGVLSAMLARRAQSVTAIEIEPKAVESAKEILKLNGVRNVTAVCGDCAEQLPRLLPQAKGECTVVLDPPRSGCDERVIKAVAASGAKKVIYISCNPSTLARDCSRLAPSYAVHSVTPFDMFPQTPNVETLCVLLKT